MPEAEVTDIKSFQPFDGGRGVRLSVTSSSSRAVVQGAGDGNAKLLIQNDGAYTAFIRFGQSDVVAGLSDMPILPGVPYLITQPYPGNSPLYVAAITATSGTTTGVNVNAGIGA